MGYGAFVPIEFEPMCVQNLKFVALPVPEIIGAGQFPRFLTYVVLIHQRHGRTDRQADRQGLENGFEKNLGQKSKCRFFRFFFIFWSNFIQIILNFIF